ncbi:F-box only protein 6 [Acorus calamus]|uniref:F-box only protein 6 n=1 Tax=Acorus calamus TaxID=4465 RepID=A0AAV9EEW8_ACOCL|nr:F-box only protein 6 [Acorus calamus]
MLLGIRVTNFLISKSIQRRRYEKIAWLLERNVIDPPPPPPPTLFQKLTQFLKKIMMSILAIPHLRREVQEEVNDDECNNSLLPELNEDVIIYGIISRLSAEEVRPMRMVCKQWLDTIDNDSNFAYLNLAHSQPGLLVQQPEALCGMKTYFMKVEQESKIVTVKPINIESEFFISGSCNGLILVRRHKTYQFFVVNPMTRTFVEIPRPPPQYHRLGISLGFDSRAGEYKVLWHFYNKKLQEREGFMMFLMGSSTGSWRMIDFPLDANQWTLSNLTWADGAWHLLDYDICLTKCIPQEIKKHFWFRSMHQVKEMATDWANILEDMLRMILKRVDHEDDNRSFKIVTNFPPLWGTEFITLEPLLNN